MMNFLNRGVEVKGTIIKTNREDILEGCIQTAVPILADPVIKRVYGSPTESKGETGFTVNWDVPEYKPVSYIHQDNRTTDQIIYGAEKYNPTRLSIDAFIDRVNKREDIRKLYAKEWLAKTIPGGG